MLDSISNKSLFVSTISRLPRPLPFAALWLAFLLCLLSLGRIVFWVTFRDQGDPLQIGELLQSFYVGLRFDLRLSLVLTLPLLAVAGFSRCCVQESPRSRVFWKLYFTVVTLSVVVFYIFDFGYYAYLKVRLDSASLSLLKDFRISSQMVFETYPVGWILLALALATLGMFVGFGRLVSARIGSSSGELSVKRRWTFRMSVWLLVALGIYGTFSWYPLRWSDAFWGSRAFASSLSSNPVLYFLATFKNRELQYNAEETSDFVESRIGEYLGLDADQSEALDFRREFTPPPLASPVNVVLVVVESLASYRAGISNNPLDTSPYLDSLANEGVYFPNHFTAHMGTARGIWAMTTGIPDVEAQRTSSRNPLVVNQRMIINEFEGYEKFYFLGGSMSWANIRGLVTHNIPGLQLFEEGSYESSREDVWGISDLNLFKEANEVFKDSSKPFFAIIQTSGNHRPYTIPEDNDGFEIVEVDDLALKQAGFKSNDDLNAFRLSDHSVGRFIEIAKEEDYFENTLFVFTGDHGIVGYAGDHSRASETELGLSSFRVPLVFYAPELLKPRVMNQVASQVDVMPSIAHLAGIPYTNTSLGRSLFNSSFDGLRYAFTVVPERQEIGLISDTAYLKMNSDGSNKRLYQLYGDNPRLNVSSLYPEKVADMIEICVGLNQTASYLRYHNGGELND